MPKGFPTRDEDHPVPPAVKFAIAALQKNIPTCGSNGMHILFEVRFALSWITRDMTKYAKTQVEMEVHRGRVPRVSLPPGTRRLSVNDYVTALTARYAITYMEDYLALYKETRVEWAKCIVSLRMYDQQPAIEKLAKCSRQTVRNLVTEALEPLEPSLRALPATRGPLVAQKYLELAEAAGVPYMQCGVDQLKYWHKANEENQGMAMCARFIWATLAIHILDKDGPFGWSQEQVAGWLGVDRSTISAIAAGSRYGMATNRRTLRHTWKPRKNARLRKVRRRRRLRHYAAGKVMRGGGPNMRKNEIPTSSPFQDPMP